MSNFTEHNGKQDRNRIREDDFQNAEHERIPNQIREVVIFDQLLEVRQPRPGACKNPFDSGRNLVILKRDNNTEHRDVAENDEKYNAQPHKYMKGKLSLKIL